MKYIIEGPILIAGMMSIDSFFANCQKIAIFDRKNKSGQIRSLMTKMEQQILSNRPSLSKIDTAKLFEQLYNRSKQN